MLDIYQLAIEKFGADSQLNQATEELAELVVAINKFRRSPGLKTREDIIEEIVDVTIMLEQLKVLFGIRDEELDIVLHQKLTRLKERLC
jgi:NTP pyrophosphatase (non-canonical NTP hydrolase)